MRKLMHLSKAVWTTDRRPDGRVAKGPIDGARRPLFNI